MDLRKFIIDYPGLGFTLIAEKTKIDRQELHDRLNQLVAEDVIYSAQRWTTDNSRQYRVYFANPKHPLNQQRHQQRNSDTGNPEKPQNRESLAARRPSASDSHTEERKSEKRGCAGMAERAEANNGFRTPENLKSSPEPDEGYVPGEDWAEVTEAVMDDPHLAEGLVMYACKQMREEVSQPDPELAKAAFAQMREKLKE